MADREEDVPDTVEVTEDKKKKKKKKKSKATEGEDDAGEAGDDAAPAAPAGADPDNEDAADDAEVEAGAGSSSKKKKKKKSGAAAASATGEGEAVFDPPARGEAEEAAEADDGEEGEEGTGASAGAKKKKKKKKAGGASGGTCTLEAQDNSYIRCLGDWPAVENSRQCPEITTPVHEQYPNNDFPAGVCEEYVIGGNTMRGNSEEKRQLERLHNYDYEKIRRAAECHRQVRRYAQSYFRPGIKMVDLCQRLESKTHELVKANGLECGWGFPTGCSLNWVAAHYTPNYGDNTVLQYDDVCKLDFGVQVGGRIVDSAFTISFNPKYDQLVQATKDGTNTGIKEAGIDARFSEIGERIQETIESYEIELNGKVLPIKPVKNLNGHSIGPYQIHGGKSVPIVKNSDPSIMEENEFYAIETFASTGKGYVVEDLDCSHYMKVFDAGHVPLRVKSSKALLHSIEQQFGTLAFCRRWLDDAGCTRHLMALKNLVDNDLVQPYPPLCDQKDSYVSQMEHTILMRPTCKEVVSRGFDY